jgi:hypothetical protein
MFAFALHHSEVWRWRIRRIALRIDDIRRMCEARRAAGGRGAARATVRGHVATRVEEAPLVMIPRRLPVRQERFAFGFRMEMLVVAMLVFVLSASLVLSRQLARLIALPLSSFDSFSLIGVHLQARVSMSMSLRMSKSMLASLVALAPLLAADSAVVRPRPCRVSDDSACAE